MAVKTLNQLELERSIIQELQNKHQTMQELAGALNKNYYTIRGAVSDLFQERKIKVVGQMSRTKVYGLTESEHIKNTIPYLTQLINRTQHKMIGLLAAVGKEDTMATPRESRKLPEYVTRILYLSNQADHNFPVGKDLEALRKEMQESYLQIKSTAYLFEQILEDPRFWTPKLLKEFVNDPEYDYPSIVKAYEYYDGNQEGL